MEKYQFCEADEILPTELKFIQDIITRMNRTSFLVKGWTVTLVAVALLLKGHWYHTLVAFIPLFVFWWLDAFFLHQERMYRRLYDWVRKNRLENSEEHLFDLNAARFKKDVGPICCVMFSKTLFAFYGSIFALTVIYFVFYLVFQPR